MKFQTKNQKSDSHNKNGQHENNNVLHIPRGKKKLLPKSDNDSETFYLLDLTLLPSVKNLRQTALRVPNISGSCLQTSL